MPPSKENKIMHWIQTILLSVISTTIIWVGNNIVDLKVTVAKLTAERTGDHEMVQADHARVSEVTFRMMEHDDKNKQQDQDINYLKAMLPEVLRKKQSLTDNQ